MNERHHINLFVVHHGLKTAAVRRISPFLAASLAGGVIGLGIVLFASLLIAAMAEATTPIVLETVGGASWVEAEAVDAREGVVLVVDGVFAVGLADVTP